MLTVTCAECGATHEIPEPADELRELPEPLRWECHAIVGERPLPSLWNEDDGVRVEIKRSEPIYCRRVNLIEGSGLGTHEIAPTEGAVTIVDSESGRVGEAEVR